MAAGSAFQRKRREGSETLLRLLRAGRRYTYAIYAQLYPGSLPLHFFVVLRPGALPSTEDASTTLYKANASLVEDSTLPAERLTDG